MKRILMSAGVLTIMGVGLYLGSTGAFFSDTETSTGNVFTAGDIDLQIDNESYALDFNIPDFEGTPTGALVANPANSWTLTDLVAGTHKFFDFEDVKPGDYGEDTISIHVGSNDAWMCAAARITSDIDVTYTEPETADDTTDGGDPMLTDGELDDVIQFAFWADDGDNVYEPNGNGGETIFLEGPLSGLGEAGKIALASPSGGAFGNNPVRGNSTSFIGKMWCAGTLTSTGLTQDGSDTVGPTDTRGTGFTCNGSAVNNAAQTDLVQGDMQFYAVQARNNPNFSCTTDYVPVWPDEEPEPEVLVGAAFDEYEDPVTDPEDSCDVTVADGSSIQTAIDGASAGQTICVEAGTHDSDTYPLRVNKDNLKLASIAGPATTILSGGVILDNDGTTVTGFTINDSTLLGETFGVYINTGVSGAVVSYNEIIGDDAVSSRGIVNAIGTTANALIAHNKIHDWHTGVFMNDSSGMTIEFNTLTSNQVGSGNDHPSGNIIRNNHVTTNTAEGVGVLSSGADSISVNFNNIFGNGSSPGDELNSYALDPVNAENNWWGDLTPADEIGEVGAAQVDFTPFAGAEYPQN